MYSNADTMKDEKIFTKFSMLLLGVVVIFGFQLPHSDLEEMKVTGIEDDTVLHLCWPTLTTFLASVEDQEKKYIIFANGEHILNEDGAEDLRALSVLADHTPFSKISIVHVPNERDRVRAISLRTVLGSFGLAQEKIEIIERDEYEYVRKNVFLVQLKSTQEYVMD